MELAQSGDAGVQVAANKQLRRAILAGRLEGVTAALNDGASPNSLMGGDPFDPFVKVLHRLQYSLTELAILRRQPEVVRLLGGRGGLATRETVVHLGEEYVRMCSDGLGDTPETGLILSRESDRQQTAADAFGPMIAAMTAAKADWTLRVAVNTGAGSYMHSLSELFALNPSLAPFLTNG